MDRRPINKKKMLYILIRNKVSALAHIKETGFYKDIIGICNRGLHYLFIENKNIGL